MRNADSWTKAASLLFIDTPLFTGFSRSSDNVTDRYWGEQDERTYAVAFARLFVTIDDFFVQQCD